MAIILGTNAYGKKGIHLSKIIRYSDHHDFRQITVSVSLKGDFDTAHTMGDNRSIVATDTQKNTVYALAKEHFTSSIENFALYLAHYFVSKHPQVSEALVDIEEHGWQRMSLNGQLHPHAYISSGNEQKTTSVVQNNDGFTVTSGIRRLLILKTTDSGFENFARDQYTTLKETSDRILATECEATWQWQSAILDYDAANQNIRSTLLNTFAHHKSLSVQQTMYAMGQAVLEQMNEVKEISLVMPNKHHIPFNLEPFGLENNNDIFIATDAPYGYITATINRSE